MTNQEKTTKILGDIMIITDQNCLVKIQNAAFNCNRDLKQKQANFDTSSWKIGDDIQMLPEHQSRKPYSIVGKIVKINKVKIKCDFGGNGLWNIPKSMLEKVG